MDEKLKQTLGQAVAAIAEACGVSQEEAANFVQAGLQTVEQAGLPKEQQIQAVLKVCQTIVSKGQSVAKYVKAGVQGFASILQSLMGKAKREKGGSLNRFTMSDALCPAGYEYVSYYEKGGNVVCHRCMKKQAGGTVDDNISVRGSYRQPYSAADDMLAYKKFLDDKDEYAKTRNGFLDLLTNAFVASQKPVASKQKGGNLDIQEQIERGPGWNKRTVIKTYKK